MKLATKATIFIILLIIVDQITKTIVKNYMYIGQDIPILGNWFRIHFIENEGMAFGMVFGIKYGKLLLTIIRIIFSVAISLVIANFIKTNKSKGIIFSFCMILAGAIGNLIDSIFYGVIYNYASLMHGKVVDMLYFPIINTYLPEWVPIWGGDFFQFFSPIFNLADSYITVGLVIFVIFYNKELKQTSEEG